MPLKGMDNVKKMIAKNKKDSNIRLHAIFFDGGSEIIKETPTDTGRVRNNWFLTVGMPSGLVGRSESKGGGGSLSSLTTIPDYVLNKKIYLTNNMPYIEVLEYGGYPDPVKLGSWNKQKKAYEKKSTGGYSKQLIPFNTPKGWVRSNLIRMRNKVRSL
tara:strand:- start:26 stop:499 length:474 start_codon:yes stop_codon:yes gene_type:complete